MKTKNLVPISIIVVLAFGLFVAPVFAGNGGNGNGAPSGRHYTLNLLGKDWDHGDANLSDPGDNPTTLDNNGHRIFVKLSGKTRIMLQEGDFDVIDADGTDGKAAFQLPKPDTVVNETSGEVISAAYYVFIRVLGPPRGQADMWSGFFDENGTEWLSLETITLRQDGGKVNRKSPPKFVDVTKELTTIYVDMDGDGTPERYGLFDEELWLYFWDYDNQGLKHVQLRFYPATS